MLCFIKCPTSCGLMMDSSIFITEEVIEIGLKLHASCLESFL